MIEILTAASSLFRSALVGVVVMAVLACLREFRTRPKEGAWVAIFVAAALLVAFPPMRVQADWRSSTSGSWAGPFMSTWLDYTMLDNPISQQAEGQTVNLGVGQTYEADAIGPRVDLLFCLAELLILFAVVWFLHSLPAPRGDGRDEIDNLLDDYDRDVKARARRYRVMR